MRADAATVMTLDADWVVTMDGPEIRRGRVVVEDGRIAAVGPAGDVAVRGEQRKLGGAVLFPGLVNAHCHLELSAYHGAIAQSDLWTWLGKLVMLRLQPGAAEREQAAVPGAVRSMLASGTTCVGDISRAAWLPGVLAGLPIRKVCYVELISGAMSPPGNMAQLRERLEALPKDDPLLVPGISPHAPYTVTAEDLAACCDLAARDGLAAAMHLAETREEIEWLRHGTGPIQQWHARLFKHPPQAPRSGATEYALAAGLRNVRAAALIHMNYADDWERLGALPAGRRPVIVYCPCSHAFFGHDSHPLPDMLAAGLTIAIGTDSAASRTTPVGLLEDMRQLHASQPDIAVETLWRMGTTWGAAALGMGDCVGRIAAGHHADLVAFPAPTGQADCLTGPLVSTEQPVLVSVGGQIVSEVLHNKTP